MIGRRPFVASPMRVTWFGIGFPSSTTKSPRGFQIELKHNRWQGELTMRVVQRVRLVLNANTATPNLRNGYSNDHTLINIMSKGPTVRALTKQAPWVAICAAVDADRPSVEPI